MFQTKSLPDRPYRVLVFEINEISWELMAPWLESGELPHFRKLRESGSWGRTFADEPGGPEGLLEPWVTWTTFCVASSMGQKPYIPHKYSEKAPPTCRIRSIERLVDVLGLRDRCEFFSTMAPHWNLRIPDAGLRQRTIEHLHSARYQPAGKTMYSAITVNDCIVITPISHHGIGVGTSCSFPSLEGAPIIPFEELVLQVDDTRKSGCHDPVGMLAFWGASVPKNHYFGQVNNLDVAPTLLTLMGLSVPSVMKGRPIGELVANSAKAAALAGIP